MSHHEYHKLCYLQLGKIFYKDFNTVVGQCLSVFAHYWTRYSSTNTTYSSALMWYSGLELLKEKFSSTDMKLFKHVLAQSPVIINFYM